MKFLLVLCLFLCGCDLYKTRTIRSWTEKATKPVCDKVIMPHSSVDVAEYKRGNTTYLIFKCGGQLFVQKVEDTTRVK